MSRIYDIIVIGGGVVGLGVFNRLTLIGYRNVLLVEKSSQILTGASAGNSGILHTGFDTTPGTLESKLVKRGYELYHAFAEDIQLPIKKIGAHLVAWNVEALPVLQQIVQTAHQNGVNDIEEISAETLYACEPNLRPDALSALFIPGECIVDPLTLPLIVYMHSKLLGGHVQLNTEVTQGDFDFHHCYWTLNNGALKARIVMNCAGLQGDHIEGIRLRQENSSSPSFTIRPRLGQFSVYSSATLPPPIQSIILPMPTKFTKGIIVYPNLFGQIIVGPTAETQENRARAPIQPAVTDLLYGKITELIPTFSRSIYRHIGSYTGIRPATEHADYQIQPYERCQWICCGGIRSTGLTSSLAIGEYVCDQLKTMAKINEKLDCQGYSAERYIHSIEQLKSMFILTPNGLQADIIAGQERSSVSSTGDVQIGDSLETADLQIRCGDECFDISHSLVKLAWTTR